MEPSDDVDNGLSCSCGRTFLHHSAFALHIRACATSKDYLSDLLSKARTAWLQRTQQNDDLIYWQPEPNNLAETKKRSHSDVLADEDDDRLIKKPQLQYREGLTEPSHLEPSHLEDMDTEVGTNIEVGCREFQELPDEQVDRTQRNSRVQAISNDSSHSQEHRDDMLAVHRDTQGDLNPSPMVIASHLQGGEDQVPQSADSANVLALQVITPPLVTPSATPILPLDLDIPLAIRRPRRIGVPAPSRFRDEDTAPTVRRKTRSRASVPLNRSKKRTVATIPLAIPSVDIAPLHCHQTPRNKLHLFCRYLCPVTSPDMNHLGRVFQTGDIYVSFGQHNEQREVSQTLTTRPSPSLGPYPNLNSFLIGEWYWTGGLQKSHADFQRLVKIIGSDEFSPSDIHGTSWARINQELGGSSRANPIKRTKGNQKPSTSAQKDSDESTRRQPHIPPWVGDASWIDEEIRISVPLNRHVPTSVPGPKAFLVGKFYRRSIISVIKERLCRKDAAGFNFTPFELLWQTPRMQLPLRVYGELFVSPAFLEEYEKIQNLPEEPNSATRYPRTVAGLMLSSDETHLTQFGENMLWPLYLFFGNDPKTSRNKPNTNLIFHLAYFIKLPETFKEFVRAHTGRPPSSKLLTHCVKEAIHAQWRKILDEEFLDAYVHGVVITCYDGVQRRVYPRIFTYSSDYKEKVTMSTIRNLGAYPCPRCLVPKKEVYMIGTESDKQWRIQGTRQDDQDYRDAIHDARDLIYQKNYVINSKYVKALLDEASLVPTENAFSSRLSSLGFNFFELFVVDLMHEIESGNWRALFIHLLRLLHCESVHNISENEKGKERMGKAAKAGNLIIELDSRYRQIPIFGQDGIRKFRRNCSEMRNLAAHDWENMLQCAIPVFDSLVKEPFNSYILDLLFSFANWHGLAKLRMHTDATLQLLEQETSNLGMHLRVFKIETEKVYQTVELPKETNARLRKAAKKTSQTDPGSLATEDPTMTGMNPPKSSPQDCQPAADRSQYQGTKESESNAATRKRKVLNLNTYKFHAIGDYVETIRRLGTTDSFSTEPAELEHRRSKARYRRTNRKNFIQDIARVERRESRIQHLRQELQSYTAMEDHQSCSSTLSADNEGINGGASLPCHAQSSSEDPDNHLTPGYRLGQTQNSPVSIFTFLQTNVGDPATKDFLAKLKAHLMPRFISCFKLDPGAVLSNDRLPIFFDRERMYKHKILRLNYITYDLRIAQDVVRPQDHGSQCNIMVPTSDPGANHPHKYARVLGIYHVNVISTLAEQLTPRRMDFLWVRWYRYYPSQKSQRLDQLVFPPLSADDAFGFVDPGDVIRACHVMPAFALGMRSSCSRGASALARDKEDWASYYISRFADRDLLMRFYPGKAIGHTISHQRMSSTTVHNTKGDTTASPNSNSTDHLQERHNIFQLAQELDKSSSSDSSDEEFGLRDREQESVGSSEEGSEESESEADNPNVGSEDEIEEEDEISSDS